MLNNHNLTGWQHRILSGLCWGLVLGGTALTLGNWPPSYGQEPATLDRPQVEEEQAGDEHNSTAESRATIDDAHNSTAESRATIDDAHNSTADNRATDVPEFVRVLKRAGTPRALQTAVATYRFPDKEKDVEVVLIGAVHIGEPTYYRELNELFKSFDGLLYELVADPGMGIPDPKERGLSPISTIQTGMKESLELTFQLDEIDYAAKNFVHADMTPEEFFSTMEARQEGVLQMFFRSLGSGIAMQSAGKGGDVGLLAALVSGDRAKGLRRAFAEQMQMMDGQMAALTGEDGKSTLITERNAKAFKVLDREIKAGKKKLGIFYGAGHLKDMHERLVNQYGMELVELKWLDAWAL